MSPAIFQKTIQIISQDVADKYEKDFIVIEKFEKNAESKTKNKETTKNSSNKNVISEIIVLFLFYLSF